MSPELDRLADSFVDYGRTDYQSLVAGVVEAHLHAAWYHKWRVHRRLRPEEYGGRVQKVAADAVIDGEPAGERYAVPAALREADVLDRVERRFGSYLLPQAYPEGSPTHPSFPAGHAVTAGSCATVLKAYFDGDQPVPNPVEPVETLGSGTRLTGIADRLEEPLTVEGELNKLAANVAIGRNWAGIHYRTDTADGLRLGERIATAVLRDRLRAKADAYGDRGSFTFTSFDGEAVTVSPEGVAPASAFDPPLY